MHLFAGAGGGILAGLSLGHTPVCAVEWEPYAQAVLVARQNDGTFPPFPIWDEVQTFDGKPWRGIADVVCGGFPCQDISVAGNGAGIDGERSGMWGHMARIIGEVRPLYVLVENSPALVTRGLGRVLGDLAAMGFDARWGVLGAASLGASHKRERIWIVANARGRRCSESRSGEMEQSRRAEAVSASDVPDALRQQPHGGGTRPEQKRRSESPNSSCANDMADANGMRQLQPQGCLSNQRGRLGDSSENMAHSHSHSLQGLESESQPREHRRQTGLLSGERGFPAWPADPADAPESGLVRVVDGMAHRSHRIKAIGNGQVPRVAAAAFAMLKNQ